MFKTLTYLLLFAVLATQSFGSFALGRVHCMVGECQCSVTAKSSGTCCCASTAEGSCCGSAKSSACCEPARVDDLGVEQTRICNCGCQENSEPIPATSETRSIELLTRFNSQETSPLDAVVDQDSTTWPPVNSLCEHCGNSAQQLFCLWLI